MSVSGTPQRPDPPTRSVREEGKSAMVAEGDGTIQLIS